MTLSLCAPPTPQNQAVATQRPPDAPKNQSKNQMWTGVLVITLVEGQDLPQHGQGDIYVRFRLGEQKFKSKVGQLSPSPPVLPPPPPQQGSVRDSPPPWLTGP